MIDGAEIVGHLSARRAERSGLIEKMRTIQRHYDNDIVVPLPEMGASERPAIANLIAQGIDQHALRIASTIPDVYSPTRRPGIKRSEEMATKRRQAVYGWWESNSMELKLNRRARHLIAYAASPVFVRPSAKLGGPVWETRSPLDTYPAPTLDHDDMHPANCIFTFQRTFGWVQQTYPGQAAAVTRLLKSASGVTTDTAVELVEWVDADERVILAKGSSIGGLSHEAEYGVGDARIINLGSMGRTGDDWCVVLERVENRAGVSPVVYPGRINLEAPKSQFEDSVGIFQMLAQMMAMEVNAVGRSIFPDTWMIHSPNSPGEIIRPADGMTGVVGEVRNGTIQQMTQQGGVQTYNTMDRLERNLRINMGNPAEFSGESGTNIRTDRRGQSVLSAAIDFPIQEHQKILARSLQLEAEIAVEIDLAYYGSRSKSFWVQSARPAGRVDYVPRDIWGDDKTLRVQYAYLGMDVNAATVAMGQQIGLGLLSKQSAMRQMPNVDDADLEHGKIVAEALEGALLQSIQMQASQGAIPPGDVAWMMKQLETGKYQSLADVVEKGQQRAQERQASAGEQGAPDGPVDPNSPEAQPGLAQPGAGAEAPAAIEEAPASMSNLQGLLSSLGAGRSVGVSV